MIKPAAYREYNKYKTNQGLFTAGSLLWFAGSIAGFATLNNSNNVSGKLFAASFIPIFAFIHFENRSKKHLNKAISIYNSQL